MSLKFLILLKPYSNRMFLFVGLLLCVNSLVSYFGNAIVLKPAVTIQRRAKSLKIGLLFHMSLLFYFCLSQSSWLFNCFIPNKMLAWVSQWKNLHKRNAPEHRDWCCCAGGWSKASSINYADLACVDSNSLKYPIYHSFCCSPSLFDLNFFQLQSCWIFRILV